MIQDVAVEDKLAYVFSTKIDEGRDAGIRVIEIAIPVDPRLRPIALPPG